MKRVACLLVIVVNFFVVTPAFAHTFQDILYIVFNGKKPPEMLEKEKRNAAQEAENQKILQERKEKAAEKNNQH